MTSTPPLQSSCLLWVALHLDSEGKHDMLYFNALVWKHLRYREPRGGLGVLGTAGLLLIGGLAALTSCKAPLSESQSSEKAYQQQAVVTVNGEKIYFDAYQNAYQRFLTHWSDFIQPSKTKDLRVLKHLLLQRMVDDTLLDQEARRQGVYISQAQTSHQIRAMLSTPAEKVGQATAIFRAVDSRYPNWATKLQRRTVHMKLIEQEVIGRIHLSASDLRDYYRKNIAQFRYPLQVRAGHMCLKTRKLYDDVWRRLQRGTRFQTLAKKFSCTPDGTKGGDLNYQPKGVLPPEFDRVIFGLTKLGELSSRKQPLQTPMGYHIFKYLGRKSAHTLSFKQAKPHIRRILKQQKQTAAYREWLENLRSRAAIHVDEKLVDAA